MIVSYPDVVVNDLLNNSHHVVPATIGMRFDVSFN
jgi:hypothetical protein